MNRKLPLTLLFACGLLLLLLLTYAFTLVHSTTSRQAPQSEHLYCTPEKHVCVMKTLFELESGPTTLKPISPLNLSKEVNASITAGLSWMTAAQLPDGGWGAGLYTRQEVRDPHAVPSDPATTALVLLSLLRTGNTLDSGTYQSRVVKATELLLSRVERWPASQPRLTTLSGTQPQQKLGENIDAILTVQYLTTLLKYHPRHAWQMRIQAALQKCVGRIEKEQDTDGGWKGGGWAPVLQSALADKALEEAADAGIAVDSTVVRRSKQYQKGNFDTATKSAVTGKAAGVMLYSLSSTTRSSAKESNKAKRIVEKAKQEGKLKTDVQVSEKALLDAGIAPAEAKELGTAYLINENTKVQSTRADVMSGFGSDGGEELISYLMTGEAILLEGSKAWQQWYETMSKKIIAIQEKDGSWQGHHCITSPVFCTAAALLILSIHQDMMVVSTKGF